MCNRILLLFCRTPVIRFPRITGKEIDLYSLYTTTISRGGWHKVNLKDDWAEIMDELGKIF